MARDDFEEAGELERQDFAEQGYARGVPMGGDLRRAPRGEAPKLMIRALRDPDNANLDRIQVIKGWLDANGETHELIYDVACSDDRRIRNRRCERPVGNTVDESNATFLNNIGDAELRAVWTDPDFNPDHPSVYYVRVMEIPTPTWQARDAKFFGIKMPEETQLSHQERAYTSPIWYTPAKTQGRSGAGTPTRSTKAPQARGTRPEIPNRAIPSVRRLAGTRSVAQAK